ncbi:hypothetical protein BJV82DRAFT_361616 [Fennellomyces sp. T-0311]|nr:hypothetical protein BJV82DRAFT_361616 [Fennellomyces sp. T-0311]
MVQPTQDQRNSPPNHRKLGKQAKSPDPLRRMVNPPDTIQCCANVSLQSIDSKPVPSSENNHRVAVVTRNDEACLLILEDQQSNMPPVVHKILPIYSDFQYTIAQAPAAHAKTSQPDFLVTFSVKQQNDQLSVGVVFTEENDMVDTVEELRPLVELARKNNYNGTGTTHQWADAYSKFGLGKKLSRALTVPSKNVSSLPYVLPVQRTDSNAFVKLRRAGTRAAMKVLNSIPSRTAKQHWIHARLMDRQDDFVSWDNAKIFAGTWNVHGSLPTEDLSKWIIDQSKTEDGKPFDPDFYVIG